MSNYLNEERLREMSKQDEILRKRKREIEKKFNLKEMCSSKECTGEDNTNILESSTSSSKYGSNDYKHLKDLKTEIGNSCVASPSIKSEVSTPSLGSCNPSSSLPHNDCGSNVEVCKEGGGEGSRGEDSRWFEDALKRAREKAKELSSARFTSVSHSEQKEVAVGMRKSKWGDQATSAPPIMTVSPQLTIPIGQMSKQTNFNVPNVVMNMVGHGEHMEAIRGIMISKLSRNNPAIIAYAMKVFCSLDLTDEHWKQCEEQMKMNIVFQLLQEKKKEAERLQSQGKVKYEYDSDEDTEDGTWEHKRRKQEMTDTALKAQELTSKAEGKHHIGDFLPPEELANFMEKYEALKEDRDPDLSDYKNNRLTEENIGYKMLKRMGWIEGAGLGVYGKGITNPVNQKAQSEKEGLGAGSVNNLTVSDDEYDAYRKRMMLAYRFRPNPLNNPRRTYY